MKKIGILTFYKAENYGAALQAFALQEKITELGYNAEHLKFQDKIYSNQKKSSTFKKITNILKSTNGQIYKYFKTRSIAHKTSSKFVEFRSKYISESEENYDQTNIQTANNVYDEFICGSDMVWSDIGQDLEIYFLTFAEYNKRIAYAPSITGTSNYAEEKNKKMHEYINGIKYLSVREKSGVEYIKKITNRDAFHAVDPTILLNKNQWIDLLKLKETKEKKYILVYMFEGLKKLKPEIKKFAKRNNLEIRYIPMTIEERYVEITNKYSGTYGPREFVELFLNASFVITNSFHGLLFSINFNIPFALIHRGSENKWKEHENRMNSILEILNIKNRYLNYNDKFEDELLDLDYKTINNRLKKIKDESIKYLQSSIEDSIKKENSQKKNISKTIKNKCTGCTACKNACPVDAITMKQDEEGFLFPYIESKKCINCGKCISVCQIENKPQNYNVINSYFGHTKESEKNSASGGIFYSIAKQFMKQKSGIVIGATLDCKNLNVKHIIVSSEDKLYKLQNSKYVQSNLNEVFKTIKKELEKGTYVLFSGTPCQIVGLKNYLKKDYNNLYLIDIVCHGVPNNKFFKKNFSNYDNSNIKNIVFRHKDKEETIRSTYQYKITYNDKFKYINNNDDPYYNSFIKNYSYRYSCYFCDFKNINRYGDITLGDCDSWKFQKKLNNKRANSIILINSKKGNELLKSIQNLIEINELDLNLEKKYNKPLSYSEAMPKERLSIYNDLETLKWNKFKKKYSSSRTLLQKIKHCIKKIIRG